MPTVHFITHPDLAIDPAVPVRDWLLSARGHARMRAALAAPWMRSVSAIHASTERKALDAAEILAAHLDLPFAAHHGLGENDRSATGYLPRAEFEATADLFFAYPQASIRGWERAIDAQARIEAAVGRILAMPAAGDILATPAAGDVAIVAHGAVGALLLWALLGEPISRSRDQRATAAGGFRFAFHAATRRVLHAWERIDA